MVEKSKRGMSNLLEDKLHHKIGDSAQSPKIVKDEEIRVFCCGNRR